MAKFYVSRSEEVFVKELNLCFVHVRRQDIVVPDEGANSVSGREERVERDVNDHIGGVREWRKENTSCQKDD